MTMSEEQSMENRPEVVNALAAALSKKDGSGPFEVAAILFEFSPPPTEAERDEARKRASTDIRRWLEDMQQEGRRDAP